MGKTKLKEGVNDLATVHPELAAQWHPTKNGNLQPSMVLPGSNKKVWWLGSCGHEWQAIIESRTAGRGCPVCAGKIVLPGYNDLATLYPELAAEWHPTKNGDLTPAQIMPGSIKKVWWQCSKGHEWQTTPNTRTNGKTGCPFCSGRKAEQNYNDLATLYPELAAEWHPTKNGNLTPAQVKSCSGKKVWWQCAKGHEWEAQISNRTSQNQGCPFCDNEMRTSFPEQVVFYYMSQLTFAQNRYLLDGKTELDVFLPAYRIGIEYDGGHFHTGLKAQQREKKKNAIFKKAGIILLRVKEVDEINEYDDTETIIYCKPSSNQKFLNEVVAKLIKRLNSLTDNKFQVDIDIERDRAKVYAQYIEREKQNSLARLHPELACEWHFTKNGNLQPSMVLPGSNKKVWWLGSCGHEWETNISNRTAGRGCPVCAGKIVLPGYNDLATFSPELAAEWHPTKNGDLTPGQVTKSSNKKVWWQCSKGHEWQATIGNRTAGRGCPACARIKVK